MDHGQARHWLIELVGLPPTVKNYQEILDNLKSCLNILICSKTEVVRIILRLSCLVCGVKLCRFIVHAKLREGPSSSAQVLIKHKQTRNKYRSTWNYAKISLFCSKTEVVRIILHLSCLVCRVKICRFIVHAKLWEGPSSSAQVLIKHKQTRNKYRGTWNYA